MTIFYPFLSVTGVSRGFPLTSAKSGCDFGIWQRKESYSKRVEKGFGDGTGKRRECLTVGYSKFLRDCVETLA